MLCHSTQREERTLPVGVFDQADEEANSTQHRVRSTEYKARSTQHRVQSTEYTAQREESTLPVGVFDQSDESQVECATQRHEGSHAGGVALG